MKTYLALNRLTFYFERTDKAFKALFGILYLTNDINSAQQFYANHYLSEALKIDEMPSYEDLLIMLFKVGSHAVKINSDFNGKLSSSHNIADILKEVFKAIPSIGLTFKCPGLGGSLVTKEMLACPILYG